MPYPRISCPLCESKERVDTIESHIQNIHNEDPLEIFIKYVLLGDDSKIYCPCGCKARSTFYGWRKGFSGNYIRGHNAQFDSCFKNPEKIKKAVNSRKKGYAEGKYKVWNKGLSNETDPRIAAMHEKAGKTVKEHYESGEVVSWRTGLTKDTDERIAKQSQTSKDNFASGKKKNWTEGLTKETDPRIAEIGKKISTSMLGDSNTRRFTHDEVLEKFNKHSDKFEFIDDITRYQNSYIKFDVKCKNCGCISKKSIDMITNTPVCFHCAPKESKGQLEVYEFIKTLVNDAIISDRQVIKPKELDIIIPSAKLAIEYNGLFYHSTRILADKDYHSKKTNLTNVVGYRLIHIFEDEWQEKRLILESMISHALGKSQIKMGARKTKAIEVSSSAAKKFHNETHLDGGLNSSKSWALTVDDKIVACLSTRKNSSKKYGNTLEISRFSSALGHSISGALSKLMKHVIIYAKEMSYERILSYVDLRFGTGLSYKNAGFKEIGKTGARFWWTDNERRFDRLKFKADKSRNMSEKQVAEEANVSKIYGCQNLILTIDL